MSIKRIIILLIITFSVGIALSMTFQTLKMNKLKKKESQATIKGNPICWDIQQIGKSNNLNLEFMKNAVCLKEGGLSMWEEEISPVLKLEKGSLDILLVGDSSIAWGIIPEIIEQITGLKVGMFACEGLMLSLTTAHVIDNVASYFLKKDGLLIIAFGGWTQEVDADSKVLVHTKWMHKAAKMSHDEFADFIENKDKYTGFLKLLKEFDFTSYNEKYMDIKKFLAEEYNLALFQVDLYLDYLEMFTNTRVFLIKKEMKKMLKCNLRWNDRSLTVVSLDIGIESKYSDDPPDPNYSNKDVARVSQVIKKINRRKSVLIQINSAKKNYVKLRSIYYKYYKDFCGIVDLGKAHPKDETYQMDMKEHTINTGGLNQSILLGKTLKKQLLKSK